MNQPRCEWSFAKYWVLYVERYIFSMVLVFFYLFSKSKCSMLIRAGHRSWPFKICLCLSNNVVLCTTSQNGAQSSTQRKLEFFGLVSYHVAHMIDSEKHMKQTNNSTDKVMIFLVMIFKRNHQSDDFPWWLSLKTITSKQRLLSASQTSDEFRY